MRRRLARFLLVTLTTTAACRGKEATLEHATHENVAATTGASPGPGSGAGSAMALDEGKLGGDQDRGEGQYAMKPKPEETPAPVTAKAPPAPPAKMPAANTAAIT